MSTLISPSQYINVCLNLLPHSTLNIQCERFLKQFHETVTWSDIITVMVPEGILNTDECCCWHQEKDKINESHIGKA